MTIRTTRRRALALGAAFAGTAGLAAPRLARAATTQLRVGHVLAATHQFHRGLELAGREVEAATDGRVTLQIFPSSQLGTERDMNIALRTGGVDMVLASPGGANVHLKELAVLDAPYLFRDNPHWEQVVYGEIGAEWNRRLLEKSQLHACGWFHRGTRHIISRTHPYETLAAIGGEKIRVADLPPYPQVFRGFGAVPTPIAFAEMYQALESGIVDGADVPLDTVLSQKLFEVTGYVNLVAWSFAAPGPILISDIAWSQIAPEDQAALTVALRKGSELVTEAFTGGEEEVKQKLAAAGMTLRAPDDLAAWEAAAIESIPDIAPSWGGDVGLYDRIRDVGIG